MKFTVDQIAICPYDAAAAIKLLKELGAESWAHDHVVATGKVFDCPASNEANLAFSYDTIPDKEFEVLQYTKGDNWMAEMLRINSASHLGMHCSEEELEEFKAFFFARNINIAQEVFTDSHTNPVIAGKRRYHYCIFDTKRILGIDLKFIVRKDTGA